jgi:hypothetical protein
MKPSFDRAMSMKIVAIEIGVKIITSDVVMLSSLKRCDASFDRLKRASKASVLEAAKPIRLAVV